ncbi:L-glutamate gamma-semialdehyde dehydrogenase [bacterium]|nr:L-glutamate gamma-semialdehyde dehydrogenase [bacterium]
MRKPVTEFRNEPLRDFSKAEVREAFQKAIDKVKASFPINAPLIIGGKEVKTERKLKVTCPSDTSIVLGECAYAGEKEADKAIEVAQRAFKTWSMTTPAERAQLLLDTAAKVRERRDEISALMVFEAGKPWREADADTAEGIDFLEYYAREMMRIGDREHLQPYLLGEKNELYYLPLGVVGVIGPWNFPMAIPTGMMSAALVTGNTVIWKPSRETPFVVYRIMEIMMECGLPAGVVNFLPGSGAEIGEKLTRSPKVQMIAFTGSREVGLHIIEEAAKTQHGQAFVKRVIAEMGGKNGLIIDSSADLDAAVPDILYSAFGFSGQKCSACSRLIVVEDVYDELMARLKEGVASLKISESWDPGCQVNAVIDPAAQKKIMSYIELGKKEGTESFVGECKDLAKKGHYVPPALFGDIDPDSRMAQEEIFGPVLSVIKAKNFEHAVEIHNNCEYALTGGLHSRTPSHLEKAKVQLRCGNMYLNRHITGAIVGRQPFGGFQLSGIGSKAGGPDYLKQFLVARACAENIMRHGIAPLDE